MKVCQERNLEFGVKITNTFPVDVKQNELPSEEMYMSGKSLYPLSISLAAKLAKEFDGKAPDLLFRRSGLLQYKGHRGCGYLAGYRGHYPAEAGRISEDVRRSPEAPGDRGRCLYESASIEAAAKALAEEAIDESRIT